MTDWKQIAIELYRDGMDRKEIREKLEIDTPTLREYLADQPKRKPKPRTVTRFTPRQPTMANVLGSALIEKGYPAKDVHQKLLANGHKVSLSTVMRWQTEIKGRQNNRVPKGDYPVIKELLGQNPTIHGTALSKLYHAETGRRLDRRAASYWCRKVRAAA